MDNIISAASAWFIYFFGKFTNINLNWIKILSLKHERPYNSFRMEKKFI
jgi:hypothetical protein